MVNEIAPDFTKLRGEVGMHVRSPAACADNPVEMESETALRMTEAATAFLAFLTPEQRSRAVFHLEDDERLNWHYIPRERNGLLFKEMDGNQRRLAYGLLSSGLSQHGYVKALDIMSLESVLGNLEGPNRRFSRDSSLYYVTVFGTPSDALTDVFATSSDRNVLETFCNIF